MSCLSLYHTAFFHVLRSDFQVSLHSHFLFIPWCGFIPCTLKCFLCFLASLFFLVFFPSLLLCSLLSLFGLLICSFTCFLLNVINFSSLFHSPFPHGCLFFLEQAHLWEAVDRVLKCHAGRASTANSHYWEIYDVWCFTLNCSSRK